MSNKVKRASVGNINNVKSSTELSIILLFFLSNIYFLKIIEMCPGTNELDISQPSKFLN